MIEFKGRRSKKAIKAQRIEICKSFVPIIIVFSVLYIALFIGFAATKTVWGLVALLFMLVVSALLCVICFATLLSKSSIDKTYRNIENDVTTVSIFGNNFIYKNKYEKFEYSVSQIIRIENWDEYYVFSFKRWKHSGLVCQKDWICEGTIEEFEKLFKDKLIDKTKK